MSAIICLLLVEGGGGQDYVPRYLCSPVPMFPDFCTLIDLLPSRPPIAGYG